MKRLMGWDLILIVVLISTPHDIATTKTIQNFYNVRNYAAAENVEIQNANGQAIPGFQRNECQEIFGDALDYSVSWTTDSKLKSLEGQAIRLCFILGKADIFSFQFGDK